MRYEPHRSEHRVVPDSAGRLARGKEPRGKMCQAPFLLDVPHAPPPAHPDRRPAASHRPARAQSGGVLLRRPRPARLSWLAARSAGARTLRTARLRPDDQSRASAADAGTSRSRAADYRWSSYRANALGASDALLSPHPLYLALGADDDARRAAYRELFRGALDEQPLSDLRLALNQDQPIGNARFYREIEAMTGQRRELRRRGRPRKRDAEVSAGEAELTELPQ